MFEGESRQEEAGGHKLKVLRAYRVITDDEEEFTVMATSFASAVDKVVEHIDGEEDQIVQIWALDGEAVQ